MGNLISNQNASFSNSNISCHDLDQCSKHDILEYIRKTNVKKIALPDNFKGDSEEIELDNVNLIPMIVELYEKLYEKFGEYKPEPDTDNTKKPVGKKMFYIKPQFDSSSITIQGEELTKILNDLPEISKEEFNFYNFAKPTTQFNTGKITLEEFEAAFNDPTGSKDMTGMSKRLLKSLPTYLKLRLINCFNDILTNAKNLPDMENIDDYDTDVYDNQINSIANIAFGKITYVYKEAKGGPKDDINSYRKIMTIPVVVNHFHRILSLRLSDFFSKNKLLDTTIQKGGISGQKLSVLQQIVKVKNVIKHANKNKSKCALLFLDVRDAFGSINRDALSIILEKYGVDNSFINYFETFYDNFQYYVKQGNLECDELDWGTGIVQGCPLSPILFVSALNFAIRYLDDTFKQTHGYQIIQDINVLLAAFVDDLVIISKSKESLVEVYNKLVEVFKLLGLHLNSEKSGIMLIGYSPEEMKQFQLDNIPQLKSYKYLGANLTDDGSNIGSYKKFFKLLSTRLNLLDAKIKDNTVKIEQFHKIIVPWITRQLAIMYDLNKQEKIKLVYCIKGFQTKWKDDKIVHLFTDIEKIMKEEGDDVVKKFELNDFESENITLSDDCDYDVDISKYTYNVPANFTYQDIKNDDEKVIKKHDKIMAAQA